MKKPKETPTYVFDTSSKYTNQRSSDCVIRAISLATGKSWHEVFDGLCEIARPLYRVPNEKIVYEKYMEQLGYTKKLMPTKDNGTKYTVREFCKVMKSHTLMVAVANHCTCIKDGKVHDIWDCGGKCVLNYWVIC